MAYSDSIIYVDESSDHGLVNIDPNYPVFVLAFCLFDKNSYISDIVPSLQQLKFKYFGHDMVVLREADIRKSRRPFDILMNREVREDFLTDLNKIIENCAFTLVASAIRKKEFHPPAESDGNPYHVAMEFCMERIFMELQERRQHGRKTFVVFERRGRQEDEALELEFRRILDRTRFEGMSESLDIVLAHKQANSAGLQLADMVARPVGRHILDREQPNRAWDLILPKLRRSPDGQYKGYGLKCYP
ncbi:MAG: DUF3800 domain-containing protein [Opitutales bacterium]